MSELAAPKAPQTEQNAAQPNVLQRVITAIDSFQRHHRLPGFIYAVIKKYGEDEAGYQSALLTYYGFLSLFPLLLVLSTVVSLIAGSHPGLQRTIIDSTTNYFPLLGSQLADHVHTLHKSGLALAIGIVFTFYGARGVADAFRNGVNHVWHIPRTERDGFPKSISKSIGIVLIGGVGLIAASLLSAAAGGFGHGAAFRLLSALVNVFILFWLFVIVLNISLPRHVTIRQLRGGALTAAIGLVVLQAAGGYLLARQLKSLDALYSTFAIALGLLFWIYLQAQVVYYSIEIATVRARQLWPRSLDAAKPTAADKRAYSGQAKKEKQIAPENVEVDFSEARN